MDFTINKYYSKYSDPLSEDNNGSMTTTIETSISPYINTLSRISDEFSISSMSGGVGDEKSESVSRFGLLFKRNKKEKKKTWYTSRNTSTLSRR